MTWAFHQRIYELRSWICFFWSLHIVGLTYGQKVSDSAFLLEKFEIFVM